MRVLTEPLLTATNLAALAPLGGNAPYISNITHVLALKCVLMKEMSFFVIILSVIVFV